METLKILKNKKLVTLTIILIIVNLFLFCNSVNGDLVLIGTSPSTMAELQSSNNEIESEQYLNAKKFIENYKTAQSTYLEEYDTHLSDLLEEANQKLNSFIFVNSTYEKESLKKSIADYRLRFDIDVERTNELPIQRILNHQITDFALIIGASLFISVLLDEEKSSEIMLIRGCKKGRKENTVKKLIVILEYSTILTLALYISQWLYSCYIYGFDINYGAPIQSCECLFDCPLNVSIGSFLGVFLIYKIISICVYTYTLWLVLRLLNRFINSNIVLFGVFLIEYLFLKISENSSVAIFKHYNLLYFVSCDYIVKYKHLPIFKTPVLSIYVITVIMIILVFAEFIAHLLLSEYCYCSVSEKNLPIVDKFKIKLIKFNSNIIGGKFELYKHFSLQKGFVLIILFALISTYAYFPSINLVNTDKENYLSNYYNEFSGSTNINEIYEFIEKSENDFQMVNEEYNFALERYKNNEITYAELKTAELKFQQNEPQQEAVNELKEHVEYLNDILNEGVDAVLINQTGYNHLFNTKTFEGNRIIIFGVMCFAILFLSSSFNLDKNIAVKEVIRTSKKGRIYYIFKKIITGNLIVCSVYSIVFLCNILYINKNYGLDCLYADVRNIMSINLGIGCSIVEYIFLIFIVGFVNIFSTCFIVSMFSYFMSDLMCVIVSLAIFIIPSTMLLFGIDIFEKVAIVNMFDLNSLIDASSSTISFIIGILIISVIGFTSFMICIKNWSETKVR